jgi:glutaredoxin
MITETRHRITVLIKSGCHICEGVIGDLVELSSKYTSFDIEPLDITNDAELFKRYAIKIPVVRLDGEDVLEVEQIALPRERMRRLENLLSAL